MHVAGNEVDNQNNTSDICGVNGGLISKSGIAMLKLKYENPMF